MSPPGRAVWLLCSSGLDGAGYVDTSQLVKVFLGALTRRLQGDQVKDVGALAFCTGAHRRHALLSRLVHGENISGQSQAVAYKPGWLQSDTSSPSDCLWSWVLHIKRLVLRTFQGLLERAPRFVRWVTRRGCFDSCLTWCRVQMHKCDRNTPSRGQGFRFQIMLHQ